MSGYTCVITHVANISSHLHLRYASCIDLPYQIIKLSRAIIDINKLLLAYPNYLLFLFSVAKNIAKA